MAQHKNNLVRSFSVKPCKGRSSSSLAPRKARALCEPKSLWHSPLNGLAARVARLRRAKDFYSSAWSPAAIEIRHYTSIDQVPISIWEQFVCRRAVGLETAHLRAVELSRINALHPHYFIGYLAGRPLGIAYGFAVDVDLTSLADQPAEVIAAIKTWKPGFMQLRVLEIGHLASLGNTVAVSGEHRSVFLEKLASTVEQVASGEGADLGIVRDIEASAYPEFRVLEQQGFLPTRGFAVARLDLKWNRFDGYLAALKSSKRRLVRLSQRAMRLPGVEVEVIEDYAPHATRLAELWNQVAKQHTEYEHERLTPAYFVAMACHLKDRSHVIAIKLEGKIVAFGLGLIGDDEYFGVAEGMDYALRDRYGLYSNIFFETIRVACALNKKTLNLGITAYDFKTSFGAELVPCIYSLKAFTQPKYTAAYAELFRRGIKLPDNKHRAFAATGVSRRERPKVSQRQISDRDPLDPFAKHARYHRVDVARIADLYGYCPVFDSAQEPTVHQSGREIIMLGTNSYLGLATHRRVKQAAREAIAKYGSGCSGSPLLNGTLDLHQQLRRQLAWFMGKQDALVFSTGYQTNLGAVSTLVGPGDVVLMDERSHASLIDGALLSRARIVRYKHANLESLREKLLKHARAPKLVITDSLFSMEGTVVDLPALLSLSKQHSARLMLDESHAIGVLGPTGRGVAEHFGLLDQVDIVMGTLSKSLASIGGFVAGDSKIIDTLRHTARSHVFSASLPPASIAATLEAIQIVDQEPERRTQLLANARYLASGLRELGFQVQHQDNAIVPLLCGNELLVLALFHRLLQEGVFVNPVTYPAVPKDHEILRLSVMATHTELMLRRALAIFARVRTASWPVMARSNRC